MSQMEHNLKGFTESLTKLVDGMKSDADKHIKELQKNGNKEDAEAFAKALNDNDLLTKATDGVSEIMKNASTLFNV